MINHNRKAVLLSTFLASSCFGLSVIPQHVHAAPSGGNVVGGQAAITATGNQTSITQTSQRAAIDWQSFSVAADESVFFAVPNGGATLNRVVGLTPSSIAGSLYSNGTLYLVNPNGLVLESGSQVFAQNFIASTANITTANFMAGQYKFDTASSLNTAKITLRGTVTAADNGVVGIFAPEVDNQGTITANLGTVVLGGAATAVVDFAGDGLMNFDLGDPTAANVTLASVSNSGAINAAGGQIFLSARGAAQLVNATVDNSGNLNATSLTAKGGTVKLLAEGGTVTDSGIINVSGQVGGGTIQLGGDFHGAAVPATFGNRILGNANQVYVTRNATLAANALGLGQGGNIVIWSDRYTQYLGNISAQGGAISGDGGLVEVSGKESLDFDGSVTTLAPHGKTGTLLLDPSDITIQSSGTDATTNSSNTITGNTSTSILLTTTLQNALAANNVTVDATGGSGTASSGGSITVANAITWTSGNSLYLTAGNGGITVDAAINGGTTGGFTFTSTGVNTINAALTGRSIVISGHQIVIKNNITAIGATLGLYSTVGSVWQDPTSGVSVITVRTVIGSSVGGFILNGQNRISIVDTSLTNTGGGGISITNAQPLTVENGITLDGGTDGVSLLTPGNDLTLKGNFTVKGSYLRLDAGGSNNILSSGTPPAGGYTITATGLDAFVTAKTTGNSAKIDVGGGSFTFVNDKRSVTSAVTLTNTTAATDATNGWGAAPTYTASGSDYVMGGLTIRGTGGQTALQGLGVVYGGTVDIQGVGSAVQVANGANTLRYIEGVGVSVTGSASAFGGSLTLVSSGAGTGVGGSPGTGINIRKNLSAATNLTLIQSGTVSGFGIYAANGTIAATSGNLTLTQSGSSGSHGIDVDSGALTAGGDLLLNQSGTVGALYHGIILYTTAGVAQTFTAGANSLVTFKTNNKNLLLYNADNFAVTRGRVRIDLGTGVMTSVSGASGTIPTGGYTLNTKGLDVQYTGGTTGNNAQIDIGATGTFTLVSSGTSQTPNLTPVTLSSMGVVRNGAAVTGNAEMKYGYIGAGALVIDGSLAAWRGNAATLLTATSFEIKNAASFTGALTLDATSGGITLASGGSLAIGAGQALTLNTHGQNVALGGAFSVTGGSALNLNLGGGQVTSSTGNQTLTANGFDVTVNRGSTTNNAIIAVGGGSFTFLSDKTATTGPTTLTATTTLANLGITAGGSAGNRTYNGLTITGSNDAAIQNLGVIYGGTVDIEGATTTNVLGRLSYIEGTGISVGGAASGATASAFAGSITLVSSGSGTGVGGNSGTGINIKKNLSAGTANTNNLTLIQSGIVSGRGIYVDSSTLTAGGAMTLTQSGSADNTGIYVDSSTLTAGGTMTLTQSGSTGSFGAGISVGSSTLTAGGNMTLTQSGSAGSDGIVVDYSTLTAATDLSLIQSGTVGRDGISLLSLAANPDTFTAGANNFVTLKTNNQSMSLWNADNFAVTSGRVRIDLGAGVMVSQTLANPFTLKATGLDVFYTGATTGNNAKIAVGGGSFTYVADKRGTNGATLIASTALADMGLDNIGFGVDSGSGSNHVRTLNYSGTSSGLTLTGAGNDAIANLGVVYGGTVKLQGITFASKVGGLSYIEAGGIIVGNNTGGSLTALGRESKFASNLTLVSNGNGGAAITNNFTANIGIADFLTVTGTLTLVQNGGLGSTSLTQISGIEVDSVVTSLTGGIVMVQNGAITTSAAGSAAIGIHLNAATLKAKTTISLYQNGDLNDSAGDNHGIYHQGSVTYRSADGQDITLNTNNNNLHLFGSSAADFRTGNLGGQNNVFINLGTGKVVTNATGGIYANFGIDGVGMNVNFTGSSTGNNAVIDIGSFGNFNLVTTGSSATPVLATAAAMSRYNVMRNRVAATGNAGLGYIYTGSTALVIDGSVAAWRNHAATFLRAASFEIKNAASFAGGLTLHTTNGGLTFVTGGSLAVGSSKTLTLNSNGNNIAVGTAAASSFTVTGAGLVNLAVGAGNITGGTLAATGVSSLNYFGNGRGNTARLNLGNGKFTNVIDLASNAAASGIYTLLATDLPNNAANGLTVTSSTPSVVKILNLDGQITVNNVDASSKNYGLILQTNSSIAVSGSNSFAQDLTLAASTGIYLGVAGAAVSGTTITIGTGRNLNLNTINGNLSLSDAVTVTATASGVGTININLTGGLVARANKLTATGFTANWLAGTGITADASNRTALDLGSGYFYNTTNITGDVTLDNSAVGGGIHLTATPTTAVTVTSALSSTSLALVTATGGIYTGLQVDGVVTINGVTSATAAGRVTSLVAKGFQVTGASTFNGELALNATGGGVTYATGKVAGIYIGANLSTGGNLTLVQSGTVTGTDGILVSNNAVVTAAGNLNLSQAAGGQAQSYGIHMNGGTLKASGDITLTQAGTITTGATGIYLRAANFAATTGRFVRFVTNDKNLVLVNVVTGSGPSQATQYNQISQGNVQINLGTGRLNGSLTGTGTNSMLQTNGGDVYLNQTAGTGSLVTLDLGGGTFYDTNFTTGIVSLNTSNVSSLLPSSPGTHGVTLVNNPLGTGAALVTEGVMTVTDVVFAGTHPIALVASKITLSGGDTGNIAQGNLTLTSTNDIIDLRDGITVGEKGVLTFNTLGKSLNISGAAQVATARGTGTIVFDMGAGLITGSESITTTSMNGLWKTGGGIASTALSSVLNFGSGTFTFQTTTFGDVTLDATGGRYNSDNKPITWTTLGSTGPITARGGFLFSLVGQAKVTINGVVAASQPGRLVAITAKEVSFAGVNNFAGNLAVTSLSGAVTVNNAVGDSLTVGGSLKVTSATTIALAGSVTLAANGNLDLNTTNQAIALGGVIALGSNGSLNLTTKNGAVTLTANASVTQSLGSSDAINFDLGTGALAAGTYKLTANGLTANWLSGANITGGASNIALDLGSGSFINLLNSTGNVVLGSTMTVPGIASPALLPYSASKLINAATKQIGIITTGSITLSGITASAANASNSNSPSNANYLKGASITVNGTNRFAADLTLAVGADSSPGSYALNLNGNLTSNGAMTMTAEGGTIDISGGVTLDSGGRDHAITLNGRDSLTSPGAIRFERTAGTRLTMTDHSTGGEQSKLILNTTNYQFALSGTPVIFIGGGNLIIQGGGVDTTSSAIISDIVVGSFGVGVTPDYVSLGLIGFNPITSGGLASGQNVWETIPSYSFDTNNVSKSASGSITQDSAIKAKGNIYIAGLGTAQAPVNVTQIKAGTGKWVHFGSQDSYFNGDLSIASGSDITTTIDPRTPGQIHVDGSLNITANGMVNLIGDIPTLGRYSQGASGGSFMIQSRAPITVGGSLNNGTNDIVLMTLGANRDITINGDIQAGRVTLNASGGISTGIKQAAVAASGSTPAVPAILYGITTNTLSIFANGDITVNGAFGTLEGVTQNSATHNNLTVTNSLAMTISRDVTGGVVNLTSGGAITGTGNVNATSLFLTATGAVTLQGRIMALAGYTQNATLASAGHDLTLTSLRNLTITGLVNNGGSNVTFITNDTPAITDPVTNEVTPAFTNNGITINNEITGNNVTLTSAGKIASGIKTPAVTRGEGANAVIVTPAVNYGIRATNLALTAKGNVAVAGAIANLTGYSQLGTGNFSLTDSAALAITTPIHNNSGAVTIIANGNAAGLTITRDITGGQVTLTSAGGITGGAAAGSGLINASTGLTLTANGAVTVRGAISALAGFTQKSTASSGQNFALTSTSDLTITGDVNNTSNNIALTTSGGGGAVPKIALNGDVSTTGTITLISAGAISTNAVGSLTTPTLNLTANGGVTVSGTINTLASYNQANSNANFALTTKTGLTVTPLINAGTGTISLTTQPTNPGRTGNGITINNNLLSSTSITLASNGGITLGTIAGGRNNATITAANLSVAAAGTVVINGTIDAISGINQTNGNFTLSSTNALSVSGRMINPGRAVSLTTTGDLTLTLDAASNVSTLNLISGGEISGRGVNASNLRLSAGGDVNLSGAIGVLAGYAQTSGNFTLRSNRVLTITAAINNGTNNVNLSTTGSGSALTLAASVSGNQVALNSAGELNATRGIVRANVFSGSANGDATLNVNVSEAFNGFVENNGNLKIISSAVLPINGNFSVNGGSIELVAPSIKLVGLTRFLSGGTSDYLTLSAPVGGNDNDLIIGSADSRFKTITLAGSITGLTTAQLNAAATLNWLNANSIISAGGDSLTSPKYSTQSAHNSIVINTEENISLNQSQSVTQAVNGLLQLSMQSNSGYVAPTNTNNNDSAGTTATSSTNETSSTSETSSSSTTATNATATQVTPNPQLMLFYSNYVPLVRLNEDLSTNYLFPMAANFDSWASSSTSEQN